METIRGDNRVQAEETRMARRVIVAVVAGYVINAVLIAGTEQKLSRLVTRGSYFAADVVTQSIIQIGSGYLCSRIANAQRLIATAVLVLVGLLIGSASVIAFWQSEAHWYAITLLCIYAPCVWVGYRLDRRTSQKSSMSDNAC